MTITIKQKLKISSTLLVLSLLTACGGSDDNKVSNTNDIYKGITSQAIITPSNINDFGSEFIYGLVDKSFAVTQTKLLSNLVSSGLSDINSNVLIPIKPVTITTKKCSKSGSKKIITTKYKNTTETKKETTYTACNDFDDYFTNGYISFYFLKDVTNPENNKSISVYKNYSWQDRTNHKLMNGILTSTGSGSKNEMIKSNLIVEDKNSNKTLKYENFVITYLTQANQLTYTLYGKVYLSNHGYVTITTIPAVIQVNGEANPSSGTTIITAGSEVTNHNSTIMLTYQQVSRYKIVVDYDHAGNANDTAEINILCDWTTVCNI